MALLKLLQYFHLLFTICLTKSWFQFPFLDSVQRLRHSLLFSEYFETPFNRSPFISDPTGRIRYIAKMIWMFWVYISAEVNFVISFLNCGSFSSSRRYLGWYFPSINETVFTFPILVMASILCGRVSSFRRYKMPIVWLLTDMPEALGKTTYMVDRKGWIVLKAH